ncbi:adhesive plaque matrix protein-like isoform X1 [Daphnia pulex]|uniref:adhesive plaque matrix protein-like isoform X1 n=1 Tax=Daphnia pulex TaxID=6669 RepID=UPI001EDCCAA3|nr:adhesive plaque matrix protein-like isoform X1 [Daphnia pulex]
MKVNFFLLVLCFTIFIFAALLAVAAAGGSYHQKYPMTYNTEYKQESNYGKSYDTPKAYHFAYDVNDDYTYNNYNHQESSDDKGYVTGSYSVYLPDGRTQTVTYKADDYTGYVADVKYTGEAKYPEYKTAPAYQTGTYSAPTYPVEYKAAAPYSKPAPSYAVAPSYPKPTYPVPSYKPEYSAPAPAYKKPYSAPVYNKPEYTAPAPAYKMEYTPPSYSAPAPYKKEYSTGAY